MDLLPNGVQLRLVNRFLQRYQPKKKTPDNRKANRKIELTGVDLDLAVDLGLQTANLCQDIKRTVLGK